MMRSLQCLLAASMFVAASTAEQQSVEAPVRKRVVNDNVDSKRDLQKLGPISGDELDELNNYYYIHWVEGGQSMNHTLPTVPPHPPVKGKGKGYSKGKGKGMKSKKGKKSHKMSHKKSKKGKKGHDDGYWYHPDHLPYYEDGYWHEHEHDDYHHDYYWVYYEHHGGKMSAMKSKGKGKGGIFSMAMKMKSMSHKGGTFDVANGGRPCRS